MIRYLVLNLCKLLTKCDAETLNFKIKGWFDANNIRFHKLLLMLDAGVRNIDKLLAVCDAGVGNLQ